MGGFFDLLGIDPSSENSPVAVISPSDLKAACALQEHALTHNNSAQSVAVNVDSWKKACSPEADVSAVFLRVSLLRMLLMLAPAVLAPWLQDGQPGEAIFKVFATIAMTGIPIGVPRQGFPFDMDELLRLLKQESQAAN